ncbi:uncharacterized protein LOC112085453 [Eutrema salsugineum]|uniref:uncharacterized protein LOC112085453 n=1 Tax=Eutrema salsugineum TaxID=72664 RepID=UPI000CED0A18|nr:uncharacterized protein LOC112085453 [Eutrema salsugineum]
MDGILNDAMSSMKLDDDAPIDLPDEDDYSAIERSGKSLIGRLLNPECQNMARMLRSMPRIWKIYDRVKGIALTRESFQFIFDLESDIQTVMKHGMWDFDDWGVVMERWIEQPPDNFLKTAPVWIRIYKIPVNHFTLKTIEAIADRIGQVKVIEYDPEKSVLQEFVRAQVIIDLEQPIRETKSLNLPRGGVAVVEIKYERLAKKCFHCLRLTHEKQRCPLLQKQQKSVKVIDPRRVNPVSSETPIRQHHINLVEKIMPMLAPSVPPGFKPLPSVVAPEVFEQIQLYMSSGDPAERNLRELCMKQTLEALSRDPVAQRSYLRLEPPPTIVAISTDNEEVVPPMTHTFQTRHSGINRTAEMPIGEDTDIPLVNAVGSAPTDKALPASSIPAHSVSHQPKKAEEEAAAREGSGYFTPPDNANGFSIGASSDSLSGNSNKSIRAARKKPTWSRKPSRNKATSIQSPTPPAVEELPVSDPPSKRKATVDATPASKVSKISEGLMVFQKPSISQ